MRPDISTDGNIGSDSEEGSSTPRSRPLSPVEIISEEYCYLSVPSSHDNHDVSRECIPSEPARPVVVYSLDADNCFLPNFGVYDAYSSMFKHNADFVCNLLDRKKKNNENTIFMIGSARQGGLRELAAMSQVVGYISYFSESYFVAMKQFVAEINQQLPEKNHIFLDKFLLDDIFYQRPFGQSFEAACDSYGKKWNDLIGNALDSHEMISVKMLRQLIEEKKQFQKNVAEELKSSHSDLLCEYPGKFTLLYQQVHYIASRFLDHVNIEFHFYDDSMDILSTLVAIFRAHPDLLPNNMTLYLHHYVNGVHQKKPPVVKPKTVSSVNFFYSEKTSGAESEKMKPIESVVQILKGIGPIDIFYQDTFHEMVLNFSRNRLDFDATSIFVRTGNPISYFFNISFYSSFQPGEFLPSITTVVPTDAFHIFNEARIERIESAGRKTPHLFSGEI